MNFPVRGYNECLIMYVLAAASPTYPIDADVYHQGWARNGKIISNREYLGFKTVLDHYETNDSPVGPLFWAHYSYLGLDPRKLHDKYADYWELNKNHALIHYNYCVQNDIPIMTHCTPVGFEAKAGWGEKYSHPDYWENVLKKW